MAKKYRIDELVNSEELYHHGIKGQKWGVRRFQDKDGSLTPAGKERYYAESDKKEVQNDAKSSTIPKGFKFNRVGQASLDINPSGALYVSSGKADAARYMQMLGPTPLSKLLGTSASHVQHIEVIDDIKKPTKDETIKLTTEFVSKNPKTIDTLSNSLSSMFIDKEIDRKMVENAVKNPKSKDAERVAFVMSGILGNPAYKREAQAMYDYFREAGYDAIPDLHDQMPGRSETASIIINTKKIKVSSTTKITKDMMKEGKQYLKIIGDLPVSDIISI